MAGKGLLPKLFNRGSDKVDNDSEEQTSRKPGNSAFKQQRLKAWQPILTASTVLPVFFFIGVVFLPIGIGLLVSSNKIQETVIDYTTCGVCENFFKNISNLGKTCPCTKEFELSTQFAKNVFMYYGLTNFYQNHRRYVRSKDDTQLHGELGKKLSTNCKPFNQRAVKIGNKTVTQSIAPCGAIANSLFNDTFKLTYLPSKTSKTPVQLSNKDITWRSDRETKYKNPKIPSGKTLRDVFAGYARPFNWQRDIWDLSLTNDTSDEGFANQDFIVWMRVAAFPTFRKLYRKIVHTGTFKDGLPKGKYQIDIHYNYPVHSFKGKKRVILTTTSWIGGKNPFLGTAYITVGSLCLVFGFVFLIIHLKVRTRSLRDWSRRS